MKHFVKKSVDMPSLSVAEDALEIHMQCSNVSACDIDIKAQAVVKDAEDALEIHMQCSNMLACDLGQGVSVSNSKVSKLT
jgi:hypothetical protein